MEPWHCHWRYYARPVMEQCRCRQTCTSAPTTDALTGGQEERRPERREMRARHCGVTGREPSNGNSPRARQSIFFPPIEPFQGLQNKALFISNLHSLVRENGRVGQCSISRRGLLQTAHTVRHITAQCTVKLKKLQIELICRDACG